MQAAAKELHDRLATHEVKTTVALLEMMLEETKDNLVTCATSDMLALQGEARTYEKLIRTITRPAVITAARKE